MKSKKSCVRVVLVALGLLVSGVAWAGQHDDDRAQGNGWDKASRRGLYQGSRNEDRRGQRVMRDEMRRETRFVNARQDDPAVRVYRRERSYSGGSRYERLEHRQEYRREYSAPAPQRIDLTGPLLLNIFLPFAIGSWVAGDYVGGGVAAGLQLLSGVIGALLFGGFGSLLVLAGWIVGIVTVVVHVNSVNQRADRASRSRYPSRRRFRDDPMPEDRRGGSFDNGATLMKFSF